MIDIESIRSQVAEFQRRVRDGEDAGFAFKDDPLDLVIAMLGALEQRSTAERLGSALITIAKSQGSDDEEVGWYVGALENHARQVAESPMGDLGRVMILTEREGGDVLLGRVVGMVVHSPVYAVRMDTSDQQKLVDLRAELAAAEETSEKRRVYIDAPVRPQPAVAPAAAVVPDLAAVAANAWTRPHSMERGEIQAALVAVLKANGAPMDRRQARLASLLCLEPHLLASMLDKTEKAQWIRVVGSDARKAASASIDATAREWGAALSGLRGRGRVLEDLQQNTWTLGTGTEAIDSNGWPDGRAGFVVNVLRRVQQSTQVDAIILKLPMTAQQWIGDPAAGQAGVGDDPGVPGSKYHRTVYDIPPGSPGSVVIDVYSVLIAFDVRDPGLQHAAKKILCAGIRGKASRSQDLREARDALERAIQEAERAEKGGA